MNKRLVSVKGIKLEPENRINIEKMFSGSNQYYNERVQEVITKLLNDIGIVQIKHKMNWNLKDLYFEEPTLIIRPYIRNILHNIKNVNLQALIQTKFYNIRGWNISLKQHKIQGPLDNNIKRLMYNNIPIGDFYSDRNLLIINFNMFPQHLSLSIIKSVCDFVKEVLVTNGVVIENNFDSEKYKEQIREQNIKVFMEHIDSRLSDVGNSIELMNNNIVTRNKEIIDDYHKIELAIVELESIKEFKKNFQKNFENQLEELEKLDFVKKVTLNTEGILIEVGNLSLGKGTAKAYIGYMSFLIAPDQIKILNKYPKNRLQHPHVVENHPCFGTASGGISKLLSKMDLKRLVFVLYQFLYTYNGRGCYPGGGLSYWSTHRKTEKRFDVDGNIITKNKIIKNTTARKVIGARTIGGSN